MSLSLHTLAVLDMLYGHGLAARASRPLFLRGHPPFGLPDLEPLSPAVHPATLHLLRPKGYAQGLYTLNWPDPTRHLPDHRMCPVDSREMGEERTARRVGSQLLRDHYPDALRELETVLQGTPGVDVDTRAYLEGKENVSGMLRHLLPDMEEVYLWARRWPPLPATAGGTPDSSARVREGEDADDLDLAVYAPDRQGYVPLDPDDTLTEKYHERHEESVKAVARFVQGALGTSTQETGIVLLLRLK